MHDAVRKFKADFFQGLGHPTRIAIVECLRDGEMGAGAIVGRLKLEQANASQHLAILRARRVVSSRREGNQIFYSVRDPRILEVLDIMTTPSRTTSCWGVRLSLADARCMRTSLAVAPASARFAWLKFVGCDCAPEVVPWSGVTAVSHCSSVTLSNGTLSSSAISWAWAV